MGDFRVEGLGFYDSGVVLAVAVLLVSLLFVHVSRP